MFSILLVVVLSVQMIDGADQLMMVVAMVTTTTGVVDVTC
jgi:hypothetical protein